jgi:RNA polymerase sigma-70 factor (ECF subfamily)
VTGLVTPSKRSGNSDAQHGILQRQALDAFLRAVQARALQMARLAVRYPEDALDIVQETMMSFVQHYADNPDHEWPALFYRVLNSRIVDNHRRQSVRQRWFGWLGVGQGRGQSDSEGDTDTDPFEQVADHQNTDPAHWLAREQTTAALIHVVEQLPLRQQQAFLLRIWEGLSTAETALAMAVSEGSVKTHLSRALASLQASLTECGER